MKNIILIFSLFIVGLISNAQLTANQENLLKEIKAARAIKLYGLAKEKLELLDKVYDSNALIIKGHKNERYSKKNLRKVIADKVIDYDTIYDAHVSAQFYNNDKICVLTGVSKVIYKKNENKIIELNFTDIYFLDSNNQWKSFYYHSL